MGTMSEAGKKRRGGHEGRRNARLKAPIVHRGTLVRNIPTYQVVNEEGVELIHNTAMRIVEEIGVDFRDRESLDIWRKAGADVSDERVRVSREMLMSLIAKAPEEYDHHARNPDRTVRVGGSNMVYAPSYGPPFVLDFDNNRRHATLEDLNNFQKINHMASAIHIAGGPIVEPVDIPVPHRHLHMAYSALKFSDKPIIGAVTARERAEDTMSMMKIVFGDEFASNNTVTTSLINSNSPLVWDSTMLDALKVYAANNQAVLCSPFSMVAASTPASTVGTMAVVTAEALMAIAFTQIIRPGAPMLFGVPAMTVDLRTGAPVHGCPESALLQLLTGMMARRYKVPHRGIANCSTAKTADLYSGYDSMWGAFSAVLAGANWITHAGGILESALTLSYSKCILDYEQMDAFYHFAQGYKFDDLDEIFETVQEVGPGGHFLGAAHTRKSDIFILEHQNNVTFEQWDAEGRKDAQEIGTEEAKRWLTRYEAPPIDPGLDEALLEFLTRRTKELPNRVE